MPSASGCKKLSQLEEHSEFIYILVEQFVLEKYEKFHELREAKTVVDAGANIRVFTAKIAIQVGENSQVIAIQAAEGDPNFL
ncbi:MAG: hypothetical protein ACOCZX_00815 [Candidatus Bipolaricaulota bacterium]